MWERKCLGGKRERNILHVRKTKKLTQDHKYTHTRARILQISLPFPPSHAHKHTHPQRAIAKKKRAIWYLPSKSLPQTFWHKNQSLLTSLSHIPATGYDEGQVEELVKQLGIPAKVAYLGQTAHTDAIWSAVTKGTGPQNI